MHFQGLDGLGLGMLFLWSSLDSIWDSVSRILVLKVFLGDVFFMCMLNFILSPSSTPRYGWCCIFLSCGLFMKLSYRHMTTYFFTLNMKWFGVFLSQARFNAHYNSQHVWWRLDNNCCSYETDNAYLDKFKIVQGP